MSRWNRARLDEVCLLVTDGTHHSPPNRPTGPYRYVTAKNIRRWGLDLTDITFVDEATHAEIYARCPVEKNDVLYIKDGVTTGLAAVNHLDDPFSMLSSVALLKPRRDVLEPRYLKHWLNSPETFSSLTSGMTGSAIKRLVLRQIRAAQIDLAPLNEQKRIADKLDSVLARVDACRDRLDRVPAILKRFRQSVLAAATSGRLTDDFRGGSDNAVWQQTTLGTCGKVSGGLTKNAKRHELPMRKPYLRVANVYANRMDIADVAEIGLTESEFAKTKLQPGDLLIVEGNGSLEHLGRVARWRGEIPECAHQNHLIRWRTSGPLSEWVLVWLLSPQGRQHLESLASTTTGLHTLSISKVSAVPIELPPLGEQTEIVRRVESLFTWADRLEARLTTARSQTERLTPALLAKAFRGELVPQDPADEPARELLARLAASQGDNVGAGRRGRPGRKPAPALENGT